MKLQMIKRIFGLTLVALLASGAAIAEDYVAIAKEGKVYDEASAKYVTLNQFDEDVVVVPGMVFATTEHTPGWYKIEYLPGMHGFIPEQIVGSSFNPVKAGTYDVANNPGQKLVVEGNGDNWNASTVSDNYKGEKSSEIVVFRDNMGNQVFSLVDIGNGPVVMNYDNTVTCFF